MDDMTAVRRAVGRLLAGALGPLLDLLAEDVEFEVAGGGEVPSCRMDSGKQPVVDYFTGLGGLTAFWQMDYTATGQQLIAWGNESFTVEHCEVEGGCEFALVFDLAEGRITRLVVIEDLASFVRGSDQRPMPHGGSSSVRYLGASASAFAMNAACAAASRRDVHGWVRRGALRRAARGVTHFACSWSEERGSASEGRGCGRSATSADPGCATRSRGRAASSRGSRRGGRRTRPL